MADLRPVYVAGDGDVKGPASSSNNFLPLFADTTGKLLKSSGTGVTAQGLAILDDNTPAEQRNTIGLDQVNNTSDVNKPVSLLQQSAIQLQGYSYAVDTGSVNACVCAFAPALAARSESLGLKVKVKVTNTGATTLNDGLGAVQVYGLGGFALQGGELLANGVAHLQWSATLGVYVLLSCTGAKLQVASGSKSGHAVNMGQFLGLNSQIGYNVSPSGVITNWGTVQLTPMGPYNSQEIGGLTWYSHYYIVNLASAYSAQHFEVGATLAGFSMAGQSPEVLAFLKTNKVTSGPGESLTSFTVSITSPNTGWTPTIHFQSTGI